MNHMAIIFKYLKTLNIAEACQKSLLTKTNQKFAIE